MQAFSLQLTNLQQNLGNDIAALLDLITLPNFDKNLWDEYKKRIANAPNHAISIIFDKEGYMDIVLLSEVF